MSHSSKHDQKEREKIAREREEEWEKKPRTIHPAWFVALGTILIVMVVLTWTLAMAE